MELKGHKRRQGRNKNPQSWQTVAGASPNERSTRAIYWAITFGIFFASSAGYRPAVHKVADGFSLCFQLHVEQW